MRNPKRKNRWVTVKGKNQQVFKGKGKDVKKYSITSRMREAAKRGRS